VRVAGGKKTDHLPATRTQGPLTLIHRLALILKQAGIPGQGGGIGGGVGHATKHVTAKCNSLIF